MTITAQIESCLQITKNALSEILGVRDIIEANTPINPSINYLHFKVGSVIADLRYMIAELPSLSSPDPVKGTSRASGDQGDSQASTSDPRDVSARLNACSGEGK